MSLPPLNLLLAQRYTFKDYFTDYPLHITCPSVTPALTYLLTYHASSRAVDATSHANHHKSLWLNCSIAKDQLPESLVDRDAPFRNFFAGDATSKGKYLWASNQIDIIHISTLYELRSILFTLLNYQRHEPLPNLLSPGKTVVPNAAEPSQIQDSEESEFEQEEDLFRPLLVISGIDALHELAGELSGQGLGRTLASAVDATAVGYRLLIHSTVPLDTEIDVLNHGGQPIPGSTEAPRTTLERVVQRYAGYDWIVPSGPNVRSGIWRFLDAREHGRSYTITWEEDESGECVDVKMNSQAV